MTITFDPPLQKKPDTTLPRNIHEMKLFKADSSVTGTGIFFRIGNNIYRVMDQCNADFTTHCSVDSVSASAVFKNVTYPDMELTVHSNNRQS